MKRKRLKLSLIMGLSALLYGTGVQAQLSEPTELSDTTYVFNENNRTALYCTLTDGTTLFFNSDLKTTKYASGYFFLTLNRIESEQQTLNIPSEYVYRGYRTSLRRVLIADGDYQCNAQQLTFPDGTEVCYLPSVSALTTLDLPATMVCFNLAFSDRFKDLYLRSVYPPYWGTSSGSAQGLDLPMTAPLTGVTMHVPTMAMDLYSKTAPYKDGTLVAMTEPAEHLFVGYQPDITISKTDGLADNARLTVPRWYGVTSENNASGPSYGLFHNYETTHNNYYESYDSYSTDIAFFYPAQLTIDADKPIKLKKFHLDQDCGEYYFKNYTDPITETNYKITPSTAIFRSPVTADEIEMTYHLFYTQISWKGEKYYYYNKPKQTTEYKRYLVSFPFDVKISDITFPNLQSRMEAIIMEFDGAKRATDVSSSEHYWRQLSASEVLHANRGYLVHFYGDFIGGEIVKSDQTTFHLKAMDTENKQQLFANGDVTVPLTPYPSAYKYREGWNLTGNPYPSFFDIRYMDFTAPITVFDGFIYYAFSPLDDEYYLYPNEAFFVQCPEGANSITFRKEGRLHNDPGGLWQTKKAPSRGMMQAAAPHPLRRVYNFVLNGEAGHDRTRIVLNEEASTDYELEHDAAKMTGQGDVPQLYVQDGGVQYAIDERPLGDGVFSLGMIFPTAGDYTLSLQNNPDEQTPVILTDLQTGAETDLTRSAYTFTAAAGSVATRFRIRMVENSPTQIEEISADAAEPVYYDLQGRIVSEPSLMQHGVYILKQGQTTRKIVVK